ncbi:MAG: folate-binding protein YgfZ [Rhodocyclaceae bacterium]|nr:folate-binding protein YgfZ [Rhodocyclaceae bacterium]
MTTPYPFLDAWHAAGQPATFEFENAESSARLADSGTVAVPLVHWRLIRIRGEERITFLHNLVSNDVQKLATGALQWNSLNSPKGRMIASFLLWKEADSLMMALSADLHAQILKKLRMYVLRSKVTLEDASGEFSLIGLAGPKAADVLAHAACDLPAAAMTGAPQDAPRTLSLDHDMFVILAPADADARLWQACQAGGATPAGTAAWHLRQIRAGVPQVTAPVQEEFVAQMLNFELIGGVSFTKGCYPGQEIVARTQYLGKLKKRMYHLHASAEPAVGADLFGQGFGEQAVGKVVLAAPSPRGGWECLAVAQTAAVEAGELRLGGTDGVALDVLELPYSLAAA